MNPNQTQLHKTVEPYLFYLFEFVYSCFSCNSIHNYLCRIILLLYIYTNVSNGSRLGNVTVTFDNWFRINQQYDDG